MQMQHVGESPSLTALYGEDLFDEIALIANEQGVPYESMRDSILQQPEMMGAFADVFGSIVEGVSQIAPVVSKSAGQIAAAARSGGSPITVPATAMPTAVAPTAKQSPDLMPILLPLGGLALIGALIYLKKAPKPKRKRRR